MTRCRGRFRPSGAGRELGNSLRGRCLYLPPTPTPELGHRGEAETGQLRCFITEAGGGCEGPWLRPSRSPGCARRLRFMKGVPGGAPVWGIPYTSGAVLVLSESCPSPPCEPGARRGIFLFLFSSYSGPEPYLNTDDAGGEGFPRLSGAACLGANLGH